MSRQGQYRWRARTLTWAVVIAFALAPALSLAFSVSAGAFSAPVMHAHDHGDADHTHDDRQLEHGAHSAGHHHHDAIHDAMDVDGDFSQDRDPGLHVHFEVCCPSVLAPPGIPEAAGHVVATKYDLAPVETLHGSPPKRLLRPPIS